MQLTIRITDADGHSRAAEIRENESLILALGETVTEVVSGDTDRLVAAVMAADGIVVVVPAEELETAIPVAVATSRVPEPSEDQADVVTAASELPSVTNDSADTGSPAIAEFQTAAGTPTPASTDVPAGGEPIAPHDGPAEGAADSIQSPTPSAAGPEEPMAERLLAPASKAPETGLGVPASETGGGVEAIDVPEDGIVIIYPRADSPDDVINKEIEIAYASLCSASWCDADIHLFIADLQIDEAPRFDDRWHDGSPPADADAGLVIGGAGGGDTTDDAAEESQAAGGGYTTVAGEGDQGGVALSVPLDS